MTSTTWPSSTWGSCQKAAGPTTGKSRCPEKTALRSEEHTSELQSRENLVCRLLLEKKNLQRRLGHQPLRRAQLAGREGGALAWGAVPVGQTVSIAHASGSFQSGAAP